MNPDNKSNNQVPVTNNVPVNNVPVNNAVGQQAVVQGMIQGVSQTGNNITVSSNSQSASELPVVSQGSANASMENIASKTVDAVSGVSNIGNGTGNTKDTEILENHDDVHQVTKILSSSFDNKNKVNLLTPQQKDELNKKRDEALREKENYQPVPVSKFKRFMSVFLIIILLLIVMFLPEINAFIVALMNEETNKIDNTPITAGTLICTNDRVDEKYNISYNYEFDFTDSKLNVLTYVESTIGDALVDADDLNAKLEKCNMLKNMTNTFAGLKVICSLSGGTLTREQVFNYDLLDVASVTTAYMEAGGEYPGEFQKDSDIDAIEKNMKASGYTCERQR